MFRPVSEAFMKKLDGRIVKSKYKSVVFLQIQNIKK